MFGWFIGDDPETTALVNKLTEKGIFKELAVSAVKKSPRLSNEEGEPLLLQYLIDKGYNESDVVHSLLKANGDHKETLQILYKTFVEPRTKRFEAAGTSKERAEKALIAAKWDDDKALKYLNTWHRRDFRKFKIAMEQSKLAMEIEEQVIENLTRMKRKSRNEMNVSDIPRKRRRFNEDVEPNINHYRESDTEVPAKPETTKPDEYHSSDESASVKSESTDSNSVTKHTMASSTKKVAPTPNCRRVVRAAPVSTGLTNADKMRLFNLMKKIPDKATAKSLYEDLHPIFEKYSTKKIDATRVVAEVTSLKEDTRRSTGATALLDYVVKFPTLLGSVMTELKRNGF